MPSGRLSQIFDSLTNLQSTQQQHYQQPFEINRQRSTSSSPSPSTSGRATPASGGAASNASAGSSGSSHYQHHQKQHQQEQHSQQSANFQYLTHTHNYFHVRSHDGEGHLAMGHNYLHTFPSTHTPSHLLQQQQQHQQHQHYLQQHYQHFQHANVMPPAFMQHTQQQQHSLPPLFAGPSHSLTASPLLPKRAISFSGQIPLNRQPMEPTSTTLRQHQQVLQSTQSTPNSPRLMPRRQSKPPPIPAKPSSIANTSSSTASTSSAGSSGLLSNQKDSTQLNPASSLDGADAPWPHFSTLTDYLDVHQVNNYGQQVPEVSYWN